MFTELRAVLFPPPPDEGFRQDIVEDIRFATVLVGGLELLLAVTLPLPAALFGVAVALLTLLAVRFGRLYERLQAVVLLSGLVWAGLVARGNAGWADAVIVCIFALVPLTFLSAALYAVIAVLLTREFWLVPVVFLAPLQYWYRRQRYESNLRLLLSTQELRLQQERALAAEHAASLERLAAAMSHELNTPVGAIKSSVQTLRSILEKYEAAGESRRENLAALHTELCESVLRSTARVQEIVARLQRLTSLDRAAVRPTDINQVLRDVAAAVEAGALHEVQIRLNLRPVPTILCETQAWIIIVMRLVTNAVAQPGQRMLELSSDFANEEISVALTEVGRAMDAGQLSRALEPAFAETGGRIGTSNWSLFQVRGWIKQLGGDLRLSNEPGGITARVTIPAQHIAEAEAAAMSPT